MARTPEAVKAELLDIQAQFNELYRSILDDPDRTAKSDDQKPRQLQLLADRAAALLVEYASISWHGRELDGHPPRNTPPNLVRSKSN